MKRIADSRRGCLAWTLMFTLGCGVAFSRADVIDVTDPSRPVALTATSPEPGPDIPPDTPARKPGPRKLEGTLIKRKLVLGTPSGPQAKSVAEALQIKRSGKVIRVIRTPMFIREWHFVDQGRQVEVFSGPLNGPGVHILVDIASGQTLATVRDPLGADAPAWTSKTK
jgi:hypothetical protein